MIYLFYSFALAIALLLSSPYWLYQALRHGKYRRGFGERMGNVPARLGALDGARVIWIHAVSLGEVLAVSGLVAQLRRKFPQHRVLISTTTDTGQDMARKRFGEENVFYFPMDFAWAIRPYLRAMSPELIILAETEFWPNFLRMVDESGTCLAVVNARISDRSFPRYQRFRWIFRRTLQHVDLFLAQTQQDSERLQLIGADLQHIQITGNLKFDVPQPSSSPIVDSLRRSFASDGAGPILVCGSTVEDEEALLLKTFENILVGHPHAVMVLAPRHPERFDGVAKLIERMEIASYRRSAWAGEPLPGKVLLVDTIGELAALYALADVAFVGGSLVPRGGHNIIEPAQHGVAIVTGNHTENFRDIVWLFQSRDAVRIVGVSELPLTLMHLLDHEEERRALGRRAKETILAQMGATSRTMDALKTLLVSDGDSAPASQHAAHRN